MAFLIKTTALNSTALKVWENNNGDILLNLSSSEKLTKDVINFLEKLDSKVILDCKRYQNEWFKKRNLNEGELLENFTSSIKSDKNYPYFKVKLVKKDNKWIPEVYNKNKELSTPESEIVDNCSMDSIIQCYAIHIRKNNTFSLLFRLVQAKVYPPTNIVKGKCMISDSSDED